jgi:hypothetical protein
MKPHAHGYHLKSLIVLHETVSGDIPGWKDIDNVEQFLASKDYGIHGMTDAEGNVGWALGLGRAIFWQAGGVNSESIGIEQVSNVMLRSPRNPVRKAIWLARDKQLRATAKLIACIARAQGIPIRYSDSRAPGITSHWDVSQHNAASDGHSDCWPAHKGGYFPMLYVIGLAKMYYKLGFSF